MRTALEVADIFRQHRRGGKYYGDELWRCPRMTQPSRKNAARSMTSAACEAKAITRAFGTSLRH